MMYKTLRALLPALVLALGVSSCSEDFDVLAPAKPFTVVYGILDASEPVNYVRIQRAYGDPTKSALDLAKLPDSSYFANITVTLQGVGSTTATTLTRVDMAQEGMAKDQGVFFTMPNYAYKIDQPLTPGRTYRIFIRNNDNGNVDTAETAIADITGVAISEFDSAITPNLRVELTPTNPSNQNQDGTYSWQVRQFPQSQTVKFVDATVRFNFLDSTGTGTKTPRTVNYVFSQLVRPGGPSWPNAIPADKFNSFYQAIVNGLGDAPSGTQRLADSADLIAYFGSPELYNYQQNQTQAGGLGGDLVQYRYTNIRGKNVIGVLGSRARIIRRNVPFTDRTVQELKTNVNTSRANIIGRASQ